MPNPNELTLKITVVFDIVALPEVSQSWRIPMAVLLGHEGVVNLDHLDPILQGLVVDQLQMSKHLGRVLLVSVWIQHWEQIRGQLYIELLY